MRRSRCAELACAAALLGAAQATAQAPPYHRLTYRVAVVRASDAGQQALAAGEVSGPIETGLRLSLRSDSIEVEALFGVFSEADTVTLAAEFFTKRRLGASRRGLPLWEQDSYARLVQLAWGDTARVFPLGPPRPRAPDSLWIDIILAREPAGGVTRPAELLQHVTGGLDVVLEAVTRPRRAVVALNLVRGGAVSAPRRYDLVPEGDSRRIELVVPGRLRRVLDVSLTRPEPPRSARDRTLALDAGIVCLRVSEPATAEPAGGVCGRLNNVSRRLPLPGGDTLVVTFAWPGPR